MRHRLWRNEYRSKNRETSWFGCDRPSFSQQLGGFKLPGDLLVDPTKAYRDGRFGFIDLFFLALDSYSLLTFTKLHTCTIPWRTNGNSSEGHSRWRREIHFDGMSPQAYWVWKHWIHSTNTIYHFSLSRCSRCPIFVERYVLLPNFFIYLLPSPMISRKGPGRCSSPLCVEDLNLRLGATTYSHPRLKHN